MLKGTARYCNNAVHFLFELHCITNYAWSLFISSRVLVRHLSEELISGEVDSPRSLALEIIFSFLAQKDSAK